MRKYRVEITKKEIEYIVKALEEWDAGFFRNLIRRLKSKMKKRIDER